MSAVSEKKNAVLNKQTGSEVTLKYQMNPNILNIAKSIHEYL